MHTSINTLCRGLGLWAAALLLPGTFAMSSALAAADTAHASAGYMALTGKLPDLDAAHPVVGYVDLTGKLPDLNTIPWNDVTHINVAFAGIDMRGNCAWMNASGNDQPDNTGTVPAAIAKLVQARNAHNPKVKLILSVGGWTMSYRFSEATQTAEGTTRLANSCVAMVSQYGLDGLDYDWEYPTKLGKRNCPQGMNCATAQDPQQLTQLLKASREALNVANKEMPLSVAVFMTPGNRGIPYDVAGMDAQLSYWNIMAYDNAAPNWSAGTGFHAAVLDAENSLRNFVAQGATPARLNLGVPYYGYVWHNATNASLGAKASGNSTNAAQISTPQLLATYGNDPGCQKFSDRNGDYFYCTTGANKGDWAAVDTERVLIEKAGFVRNNGFGGVMVWSITMDNAQQSLTKTLNGAVNNPSVRDIVVQLGDTIFLKKQ